MAFNNLKKWLTKKAATVALSMANVEKNILSQNGQTPDTDVNQERRHTQGQLMDSLIRGEITEEVKNLRWRMYSAFNSSKGFRLKVTGIDNEGNPIFIVQSVNNKQSLDNIKVDNYDNYKLQMVVDNSPIAPQLLNEFVSDSMTAEELSTIREENPINITRSTIPKFDIEKYTKKLLVRDIDGDRKLLEFYVSRYPEEHKRSSYLFISELKKSIENPRQSSILDITSVKFITDRTLGVDDFLEYEFKIESFDKIITFNEYYVIKFIASTIINGNFILEDKRVEELDQKYANKEKRKRN